MTDHIWIWGTLKKDGEKDIHLLVYRDRAGYCVITNGSKDCPGGTVERLEPVFDREVKKHRGYEVKFRVDMPDPAGKQ